MDAVVVDGGGLSEKELDPKSTGQRQFVVEYVSESSQLLFGRSHFDLSSEDLSFEFGHSSLCFLISLGCSVVDMCNTVLCNGKILSYAHRFLDLHRNTGLRCFGHATFSEERI
jgi:hypothetical protein